MQDDISKLNIEFYRNFELSKYCTWRSGCLADYIFYPKNLNDLYKLINLKKKFYMVGNGSNTLFLNLKDTILISTKKMNSIEFDGEYVVAECGTALNVVMNKSLDKGLLGFEFLTGIPGTVGGALITNAGANGGEISDVLVSVFFIKNGKEIEVKKEEIEFKYRTSSIKRNEIITKAKFLLRKGDPDKARIQIKEYLNHRNNTQPVRWPSAGSVFKNPLPNYAGLIIENLGLKGLSVGDAQVSNIHSNYIINKNNASPENILSLVNMVKDKVLKDTGIKLENEIRIIDEK
ncbi:UDP-N-acetylenolpyruvoylglucosamine reductase [bacterium]|mgnify:FL=1|nr:UDP-N-acetylmuramate dehydrogenase [Thermodesulfobacteriota bacterium]NSW96593.1 UDP-N-acetylmuramate dehydrogenase [bacterium]GIR28619.1 MAG: UDP-N-acetylenolpyruvoylglucosamine reductase [bacterium]